MWILILLGFNNIPVLNKQIGFLRQNFKNRKRLSHWPHMNIHNCFASPNSSSSYSNINLKWLCCWTVLIISSRWHLSLRVVRPKTPRHSVTFNCSSSSLILYFLDDWRSILSDIFLLANTVTNNICTNNTANHSPIRILQYYSVCSILI